MPNPNPGKAPCHETDSVDKLPEESSEEYLPDERVDGDGADKLDELDASEKPGPPLASAAGGSVDGRADSSALYSANAAQGVGELLPFQNGLDLIPQLVDRCLGSGRAPIG